MLNKPNVYINIFVFVFLSVFSISAAAGIAAYLDSQAKQFAATITKLDDAQRETAVQSFLQKLQSTSPNGTLPEAGHYLTQAKLSALVQRLAASRTEQANTSTILSAQPDTQNTILASPSNDDFSAAISLFNTAPGSSTGTTVDATTEISEPLHTSGSGQTVWYKWTAPNTDPIDFDTLGSNVDTVLAIYTGTGIGALQLIDSNDDDPIWGCCTSRISLTPVLGTNYYIQVDIYTGAPGFDFTLNWGPAPVMNTIQGTISLPTSAGPGGESINISAQNQNGSGYFSTNVTILENTPSIDYELSVTPDINANFLVAYSCWNCDAPLLPDGYYADNEPNDTSWDQNLATPLPGANSYSDINMTVVTGKTISGTISLPSVAGPGGENIIISAQNQNGSGYFSTGVTIPEDSPSFGYELVVTPDTNADFLVAYSCWNCDVPLLRDGYYADNEPNDTSWDQSLATPLPGTSSHSDIDMTVVTGNTISGTISSPSQAGPGGTSMAISVTNQAGAGYGSGSGSLGTSFTIAEGDFTSSYAIAVPDASVSWHLSYYCWDCSAPLIPNGYFASGEPDTTAWDPSLSTPLIGNIDNSGKDMRLIEGNTISGTVSLPNGVNAVENLQIRVWAMGYGGFIETDYPQIPSNANQTTYSVLTPPWSGPTNISYLPSAYAPTQLGQYYFPSGFYNSSGTKLLQGDAEDLPLSPENLSIDMEILPGTTLSGTVSLPMGKLATSDLVIYLIADTDTGVGIPVDDDNSGGGYGGYGGYVDSSPVDLFEQSNLGGLNYQKLIIPQGTNATNYSFEISYEQGATWRVYYVCASCAGGYQTYGYHVNNSDTSPSPGDATQLPDNTDHTAINLQLLPVDDLCVAITAAGGEVFTICL